MNVIPLFSGIPKGHWPCLFILWIVLFSAGCGDLLRPDPLRILTLNEFAQAKNLCSSALPVQIIVDTPEAYSGLESERMALLLDNREIQYISGYKWDTSVPLLVRRSLVNALNDSGCFSGAGGGSDGLNSPYHLKANIRRMHFLQDESQPPAAAMVLLELILTDFSSQNRISGRHLVSVRQESESTAPYALGTVMEKTLAQAMRETVLWCHSQITAKALRVPRRLGGIY